ncbi:MAG: Asp-tRNA(Asn)/Glu-tRNA(Gln) amidotransferase subunit GatB [Candidatus Paceibacterota bacterium]
MATYKPTIGIEVHAELSTLSKMFCGCANRPHVDEPNVNICPICLAHPGTLPAVNKEAIRKVLQFGEVIGGELADFSEFDRKQYFYPDIPKAYQLSQYAFPFVKGGELAGVAITRVHLEEDTARSQHEDNESFVDFNRAGVPLMELVTEPVIHDAKVAADFAKELQLLLRTMGVSSANMEKGEMRVEANISISDTDVLGTKVEVKNLNSFKAVENAINYEIERQKTALQSHKIVIQETRGWNMAKNKTFSQRSKETAKDYRYFPDPDIPKYFLGEISEFTGSRLAENIPNLPSKIRADLSNLGLTSQQVETLVYNPNLLNFLEATMSSNPEKTKGKKFIKTAANYLISDVSGLMANNDNLELNSTNAIMFARLILMVEEKKITSRVAKDLLEEIVFTGSDPEKMAEERGIMQDDSSERLIAVVEEVISANEPVVGDYKNGKEAALQFLVGQGMKLSKGSANPTTLAELFKERLSE